MKYKVAVFLNRVETTLDPEYFVRHGVYVEFTYHKCDVYDYESKYFPKPAGSQYQIVGSEKLVSDDSADAIAFIVDGKEWRSEDGAEFPLRPDTPSGNCMWYNGKPFINMPIYNGLIESYPHEIMHALCLSAKAAGFPVEDVMDTYEENADPESPTGNFAKTWENLAPYIKYLNELK